MNRIETRIIMMVTNRLSAAKDSEEKTELIEELSENLYQRYTDLTAADVSGERRQRGRAARAGQGAGRPGRFFVRQPGQQH